MGTSESIVVVAGQHAIAVDVGPAKSLLKVERHDALVTDRRFRCQHPNRRSTPAIARERRQGVSGRTDGALVRAVAVARRHWRAVAIERELVIEIERPATKRIASNRRQ